MKIGKSLSLIAGLVLASPAAAEVVEANESGFTVTYKFRAEASASQVWDALVEPSRWWSPEHSWSGDAAHFSLEPIAGGCFCERWGRNSVEHARVIFAARDSQLRLRGALGPLQGEALTGVLTFTLKPDGDTIEIGVDYVVGGHARFSLKDIAPAVDAVIGEQASRLAGLFDPAS